MFSTSCRKCNGNKAKVVVAWARETAIGQLCGMEESETEVGSDAAFPWR